MNASDDIFESSIRPDQDLAGIYEQDADGGYFYLYDLTRPEGQKVIAAVQIHSGRALTITSVEIEWDESGSVVGLFVAGNLLAAFSETGQNWRAEKGTSEIPQWVQNAFATRRSH